jgi:hypothetical protein
MASGSVSSPTMLCLPQARHGRQHLWSIRVISGPFPSLLCPHIQRIRRSARPLSSLHSSSGVQHSTGNHLCPSAVLNSSPPSSWRPWRHGGPPSFIIRTSHFIRPATSPPQACSPWRARFALVRRGDRGELTAPNNRGARRGCGGSCPPCRVHRTPWRTDTPAAQARHGRRYITYSRRLGDSRAGEERQDQLSALGSGLAPSTNLVPRPRIPTLLRDLRAPVVNPGRSPASQTDDLTPSPVFLASWRHGGSVSARPFPYSAGRPAVLCRHKGQRRCRAPTAGDGRHGPT